MVDSNKIMGASEGVFPGDGDQKAFIEERFPGGPRPFGGTESKASRIGVRQETNAQDWMAQITLCEKAFNHSFIEARKNLQNYQNKANVQRISVPLLAPMVEIKASLASFRDPYISVRPRRKAAPTTPMEVMASAIKETYINWLWRSLDMKKEIRRVIRDTLVLTGRGIATPGYNVVVDPQQIITHDSVIAYRTSPFDYMLDIECDNSRNAFYGIRRIIMPIWQAENVFRKKGVFSEVRYSKWAKFKSLEHSKSRNTIRKFARTVIYEIQDLMTNQFYFVTPSYMKFLDKFENPYPIDGLLPEFLEPMPVPDDVSCIPEASLIRPQLDELTRLRNMWMEIWKRQIPKHLVENGAVTGDQLEKLVSSEVAAFAEVQDKEGIKLLDMPSGTADMQYHEMRVKDDISEITGWNKYMQGSAPGGRKTAYEVREIVAGSNIRITDLNDSVEQFCSRLARKMLAIAAKFVGVEEMQAIVGLPADLAQVGLPQGFALGEADIREDSDVTVMAGSMQVPGKEQDMQKAMLLQSFLAYPETNRASVLQEMAKLMDLNPMDLFAAQEQVDPQMQQQHMLAMQGGGRGKEMGGALTGGVMGSRPRPDAMLGG